MSPRETATRIAVIAGTDPVGMARLQAAGLTRGQVRACLNAGLLERTGRGLVALRVVEPGVDRDAASLDDITRRAHSLIAALPGAVLSHATAALLQGMPTPDRVGTRLDAYDPSPHANPTARLHRGRLRHDEVTYVDDLPVTTPLRTAIDLALGKPLPRGLIPLDHAVRRLSIEGTAGLGLPEDEAVEHPASVDAAMAALKGAVGRARGRHGIDALRRAASHATPLSESPGESLSRGHLIEAGLTPLALQVRVVDAHGTQRRLDFLLAPGLAGECDGLVKYRDAQGWDRIQAEKARDLALAAIGITTIRWTATAMFADPQATVSRIRRAVLQSRRQVSSTG